jgi:hypothetical protein
MDKHMMLEISFKIVKGRKEHEDRDETKLAMS